MATTFSETLDFDNPTQPPPLSLFSVSTQSNRYSTSSPLDVFQDEINKVRILYQETLKEIQQKATPNQKEVEQNIQKMKQQIPNAFSKILDQTKKIESLLFSQKLAQTITIPRKIRQFEESFSAFKQDFEVSLKKMKNLITSTTKKLEKQREVKTKTTDLHKKIQNSLPDSNELLKKLEDQERMIFEFHYSTLLSESEEIPKIMLDIEGILSQMDLEIQNFEAQSFFNVDSQSDQLKMFLNEQKKLLKSRINGNQHKIDEIKEEQKKGFDMLEKEIQIHEPTDDDLNDDDDEDLDSMIEEEINELATRNAEIQEKLAKFKPESCLSHDIIGWIKSSNRKIRMYRDGVFEFID